MKIKFEYESIKYVIGKKEFIKQLSEKYNKNFYHKQINMTEYMADIFVSDKNIRNIIYIGNDFMYYKIIYNNGMNTTISKENLIFSTDFLEAKVIEGDLVVLEMPHYSYLSVITGYSVLRQYKTITIDTISDKILLLNKLQRIFKQAISNVEVLTDFAYKEKIYNGNIEYIVNNKSYKTNDKLIYETPSYKYVYIPENKLALILKRTI